jgi:DNA-binding response OmpR family regulator
MAPLPGAPVSHEAGLTARILVVDDDDALREMVRTALSLRGAEVVTARSADEARAAEGRFDIALIDMMLDSAGATSCSRRCAGAAPSARRCW